jgi:4-hydroxy-tetrahydrodipicolinate reductase
VFAANFALGGVVMMHLAAVAARYFDNAEIIEMHHDQKADAPSGTAIATAQLMARARGRAFVHPGAKKETLPHPRGAELDGIALHSMRLPGALAHQEVVFGALGQTLHIRHNALNRECYMPGVVIAIKAAMQRQDLAVGLETVLGLS